MLIFALIAAGLVIAGFMGTFFIPLARRTFSAPWFVYVHGALFFSWISLLIAQAGLVANRKVAAHRRLGQVAVFLIPLMILSALAVIFWSTARDYRAGQGDQVISAFFGELMDVAMFACFATAAIQFRRRPMWHKRLILLATLAVLGAAVGRIHVFRHRLGDAGNYVTLSLHAAIIVYDVVREGRPHMITVAGGAAFVVGVFTENLLGSTPLWLAFGAKLATRVHFGMPPN